MATRSTITLKLKNGKYKSVYCHWDGYPEHHLPILTKHYNTYTKVNKLLDKREISVLSESMECPEGHTFDKPKKGYCVFYKRDRNEKGVDAKTHTKFDDIDFQEYNYLFKDGGWLYK